MGSVPLAGSEAALGPVADLGKVAALPAAALEPTPRVCLAEGQSEGVHCPQPGFPSGQVTSQPASCLHLAYTAEAALLSSTVRHRLRPPGAVTCADILGQAQP